MFVSKNLANLTRDQRGAPFGRVSGAGPDIGSVEVQHNLKVTNLNEAGPGSLRSAVAAALINAGSDTISFQAGLTGTITLSTGVINLTEAIAIEGPGSSALTINANFAGRILDTSKAPTNANISLSGLTLANGTVTGSGGAIYVSDESLTLTNCVVTGSSCTWQGGGIYVYGKGACHYKDVSRQKLGRQ